VQILGRVPGVLPAHIHVYVVDVDQLRHLHRAAETDTDSIYRVQISSHFVVLGVQSGSASHQ
jgi:hypothetical protein